MIFDSNFLLRFPLRVTGLIWLAGALLTYGSIASMVHAIQVHQDAGASMSNAPSRIERIAKPLALPEATAIVKRLEVLHPAVKFSVNGGNITISVQAPSAYDDWRVAIADLLQSGDATTSVETESICGAGCSGGYCVAEFSLKKVEFSGK
jgi:hypothetical protein